MFFIRKFAYSNSRVVSLRVHMFSSRNKRLFLVTLRQINYSFSCLQCPSMYAEVDEKTGETIQISKPIPLPALNVSHQITPYGQCMLKCVQ